MASESHKWLYIFCMTYPSAHHTSPPYDTGLEPWVWADSSSPQYRTSLYTGSVLDHYIRTDRNIGSYPTVSSYLSSWILHSKKLKHCYIVLCVKSRTCILNFVCYFMGIPVVNIWESTLKWPKSTHYLLNHNLNQYTYVYQMKFTFWLQCGSLEY